LERAREEQQAAISASRRSMVGSGDRSERIRTYNFPQSRVTDHRVNVTLHTLERVLDGELDPIVDALVTSYQAEALKTASYSLFPLQRRHRTDAGRFFSSTRSIVEQRQRY